MTHAYSRQNTWSPRDTHAYYWRAAREAECFAHGSRAPIFEAVSSHAYTLCFFGFRTSSGHPLPRCIELAVILRLSSPALTHSYRVSHHVSLPWSICLSDRSSSDPSTSSSGTPFGVSSIASSARTDPHADHPVLDNDLGVKAAPPYTLYSFTSRLPPVENAQFFARGSDVDIGGYSTNEVTSVPYPSASSSTSATLPPAEKSTSSDPSWSHVAFHGNMSLRVPQEQAGKIRTGYAGIRNRKRMTLFGEDCWDLSSHTHLKVEVAYRGWEGWRNRWYCNIQTDSPVR